MQTSAICHIRSIPALALLLVSGVFLDAQVPPEEIRLGGRAGWDHIELRENVMMVDGWQGGEDLALSDWGARIEATTDMLAPFDFSVGDGTGRYRTDPSGVRIIASDRKFGTGAAAFDGQSTVTYRAGPDALLAPDTKPGSFTIDFWLNPFRVSEGASILRWRGALINSGRPVLQELRFEIRDNRAVWESYQPHRICRRAGRTGVFEPGDCRSSGTRSTDVGASPAALRCDDWTDQLSR
jgi:hypothetical protein